MRLTAIILKGAQYLIFNNHIPFNYVPRTCQAAYLAPQLGECGYNVQILLFVRYVPYLPRTGDIQLGYGRIATKNGRASKSTLSVETKPTLSKVKRLNNPFRSLNPPVTRSIGLLPAPPPSRQVLSSSASSETIVRAKREKK